MARAFEFDGFRLEPEARSLTHRGARIHVTAKAVAVLALLAERAPEIVTRADFEAAIWPEGYIEPANLTQTIYMLRKALATPTGPAPIETVTGRGYRLATPVRQTEEAPRVAARSVAAVPFGGRLRRAGVAASLAALLIVALLLGFERVQASKQSALQQQNALQQQQTTSLRATLKPPSRPG